MSKSKNNVVDPLAASELYTMEGLRYFLLREGVAHSDGIPTEMSPEEQHTQLDASPRHVRKDPLDWSSYTAALSDIHREVINTAVSGYYMNVVLGGRSPPIAEIEKNKSCSGTTEIRMK
ncbi:mitochondrial, Methionine--tRNA ligase [Lucilia cuprina]|nr:mitochondrial, Methionine--tRNA ligase [Lucilia cuprina]